MAAAVLEEMERELDPARWATVEVSVSADLAVNVLLTSSIPARCEEIRHGGALPELPVYCINMYIGEGPRAALAGRLGDEMRQAYRGPARIAAE